MVGFIEAPKKVNPFNYGRIHKSPKKVKRLPTQLLSNPLMRNEGCSAHVAAENDELAPRLQGIGPLPYLPVDPWRSLYCGGHLKPACSFRNRSAPLLTYLLRSYPSSACTSASATTWGLRVNLDLRFRLVVVYTLIVQYKMPPKAHRHSITCKHLAGPLLQKLRMSARFRTRQVACRSSCLQLLVWLDLRHFE